MTVVTVSHVTVHNVRLPNLRTPALTFARRIGRLLTACGYSFVDASKAYALAQELAYVKSGGVSVERQRLSLDTDGEGRDPSW